MPPNPTLYVARVETTSAVADFIDEAAVLDTDDQCTIWYDADRDLARIEYFCPSESEAQHRLSAMQTLVKSQFPNAAWTATTAPLPVENWAEAWKRFFHTEKVSDRIWIKPSWEPCSPAPGDIVLEIDPGMSFGTGQHGTTRGCLCFMDTIAMTNPSLRLIDVGCGSGILSIAAVRLGFSGVTALDNDPESIRVARENADLNGVTTAINFGVADLATLQDSQPFDVVVANILAVVLIQYASILSHLVAKNPSASLILSGILNPQADDVIAAFVAQGFELHDSLVLGEWTSLWMKRPVS
jgi:ribosomal protein L11 methyltransferase